MCGVYASGGMGKQGRNPGFEITPYSRGASIRDPIIFERLRLPGITVRALITGKYGVRRGEIANRWHAPPEERRCDAVVSSWWRALERTPRTGGFSSSFDTKPYDAVGGNRICNALLGSSMLDSGELEIWHCEENVIGKRLDERREIYLTFMILERWKYAWKMMVSS